MASTKSTCPGCGQERATGINSTEDWDLGYAKERQGDGHVLIAVETDFVPKPNEWTQIKSKERKRHQNARAIRMHSFLRAAYPWLTAQERKKYWPRFVDFNNQAEVARKTNLVRQLGKYRVMGH
jgi:hypothetical protein